jgi:hydrogenase maturation protease
MGAGERLEMNGMAAPAPPCRPILVLGIGNLLMQDEGVGVRVIEALGQLTLPSEVELYDGGTAGCDLIDILADRRKVIVVDALQNDDPPGTILRLTPDDLLMAGNGALSLHELGLPETLAMTRRLGCAPREVVVLAVRPAVVDWGVELSPIIAALIPRLIELILREL